MWQQRWKTWFDTVRTRLDADAANDRVRDADDLESSYETIIVGARPGLDCAAPRCR